MQEAITRRGFMWGAGMAGIAAAAVLTGCSAGSGSGQPQESNASTDVTQVTLDDAKLTADDLCAAAFQFKTLSEAGTSDEYEREYRFALAASALGNADAMLYLGEMYQGSHIEAARSSDNPVQDAVSWWNKAAESGVARGGTQDVDKAISILKELVDGKKHDMVACALMLGDIYSEGVYTAPDAALAKSYYQIVIDNAREDSDEAEKAASALEALG